MDKETPHVIRRSFEMLLEENVQSVADILKALPFPVQDIEELAELQPGSLGGQAQLRVEPTFKSQNDAGNVIPIFGDRDHEN